MHVAMFSMLYEYIPARVWRHIVPYANTNLTTFYRLMTMTFSKYCGIGLYQN